ncbi:S1/P1 nuclease [Cercophora newfieldiana]|uniref:S1/P1 nuclease n=1 Tax=Cercophora newfieldiana TaxID=92897 RepID=A0AA39Y909_9PEZI|nr:S1/P1 nuclease [Cercophora newfieldiana]
MRFEVFATLALVVPGTIAWGGLGHRTVAYLAKKHLTDEAVSLFDQILKNDFGYDYSDAATWADTVKRSMPWSSPFHYINPEKDNPPETCEVTWSSDCPKKGCVVSAIANYTSIVLSTNQSPIQRKNATMFIMHLIGDLHQPLHAIGWKTGGNELEGLCWKRLPPSGRDRCAGDLNLHAVWDARLAHRLRGLPVSLDTALEKQAAAQWADDLFSQQQAAGGAGGAGECAELGTTDCIVGWTKESNALVCSHVLKRGERWILKNDLSEEYFEENWEVVESQIAKAGLRLAAWMNAIAASISKMHSDL